MPTHNAKTKQKFTKKNIKELCINRRRWCRVKCKIVWLRVCLCLSIYSLVFCLSAHTGNRCVCLPKPSPLSFLLRIFHIRMCLFEYRAAIFNCQTTICGTKALSSIQLASAIASAVHLHIYTNIRCCIHSYVHVISLSIFTSSCVGSFHWQMSFCHLWHAYLRLSNVE